MWVEGFLGRGKHCEQHTSFLFDASTSLAALAWNQAGNGQNLDATAKGLRIIDIQGDRSTLEFSSTIGCDATSNFIGRYSSNPSAIAPRYVAETLYNRVDNVFAGRDLDGTATADLFGDSREEYVYWTHDFHQGVSNIVIAYDPAQLATPRTSPSPYEFLQYRRRSTSGISYSDYVNFEEMEGLRFVTEALPDGDVGTTYGVDQDRHLDWRTPNVGRRAGIIAAEGGVPPYTMAVSSGNLPTGLSWSVIPHDPSAIPTNGSPYGGMLQITGTPTECGTKRFTVKVEDSTGASTTRDYWLKVKVGLGGACTASTAPHIRAAGFDGTYLVANVPGNVTIKAQVDDAQGDVAGINILDSAGNFLRSQTQHTNGLFSITVPVTLPQSNYDFRIVAFDLAGNTSASWPYLNVPGAPSPNNPGFDLVSDQTGQTAANTPTIEWVELPPHSIQPAEKTDAVGAQLVRVHIKSIPAGSNILDVTVRVQHNIEGVQLRDVVMSPTSDPMIYEGTFQSPAGWMGWGNYAVNARVSVTDATQVVRFSDWWPQLRAH